MPVSSRALILLGVALLGVSAFNDPAAAAQGHMGARSDRVQKLPVTSVRRVPPLAPIVTGPAPRVLPSSRLSCVTKQVRVCPPCGPNGCPYSYTCHLEARCVRAGR
jgi:hypothetical protein